MYAAVAVNIVIGMAVRLRSRGMRCLRRSVRRMRFFAQIDRSQLKLAKESHEPQAEHVKRSETSGENADAPDNLPAVGTVKHRTENFVLAEEAGERRNSRNGNGGDGHHPEGNWDFRPQAAHAAHVLLAADGMNHRARAQEEQR